MATLEAVYQLLLEMKESHTHLSEELAAMRLELEQIKVQKTLLSGSLQESAQRLAEATALLERVTGLMGKPFLLELKEGKLTNPITYTLDVDTLSRLIVDSQDFLAKGAG